ncbi:MAG: hypothetical protein COA57_03915 [Flavobacteriales bacterium]|nr:hypothetical protein [Bacteroidales bacterium AH-315-I05]PCJ88113.1 MAG: hypothetical protein COA57_03915 [Flavobacteriales bacterium]
MKLKLFLFFFLAFFSLKHLAQTITTTDWQQLVPSENLPLEIQARNSNNNLDLVKYRKRYYFAFRTAPLHFASKKTKLYIVSSDDLKNWQYETEFHMGNDLREPRFIIYHDTLFFYFFEGGKNIFKFQPRHVWATCFANGHWLQPKNMGMDGYVPWRIRERSDTLYLSAYYGVNLYKSTHSADLRLFYSTNGLDWKKLSDEPQISGTGGEEGEFIFDKDGNLWGTVRLEGEGGIIVHAHKDSIGCWQKKHTPYKYDSALLFEHDDEIYLISRRNLDGTAAKAWNWLPHPIRQKYNLLRYSFTNKKTALFRFNKEKMEIEWVMDFPSTGDTAFPAIAQYGKNSYALMNYSSDFNKRPKNWFSGQLGKTYIYWTVLSFDD